MSIVVASEVGLSEKPIIFTAWSIARIQAGLKTPARRVSGVYTPGELRWVKEALLSVADVTIYAADHRPVDNPNRGWRWKGRVLPAMFMPRWASRLLLEVTGVREERLREITPADALAEGCESVQDFALLWDRLNARRGYPWASSPLVRVVGFLRGPTEPRRQVAAGMPE